MLLVLYMHGKIHLGACKEVEVTICHRRDGVCACVSVGKGDKVLRVDVLGNVEGLSLMITLQTHTHTAPHTQ